MIVKLYKNQNSSPIKEYIDQCSNSLFEKITRQIKYLQEYGLRPEVLNLKKLKGYPIWEIRVLGKDNIRILCSQSKEVIWIWHIFSKKSMKTPLKDLRLSLKRYYEIIDN